MLLEQRQLTYFGRLEEPPKNSNADYKCEDRYYLNFEMGDLIWTIASYFRVLAEWVSHPELPNTMRQNIRTLVQLYMTNLWYFPPHLYYLWNDFLTILGYCGTSEDTLDYIQVLLKRNQQQPSWDVAKFIGQAISKQVFVKFTDVSDPIVNGNDYNSDIEKEKAHAKVRVQAASKIQSWWRSMKKEDTLYVRT